MINGMWLEIIVAGILLFSVLAGCNRGFVKTVYGMIRFVLSIIVSILLAPVIVMFIPETVMMRYGIAYLAAFITANVLLSVIHYALGIVDHIPLVKQVNKAIGGIAGLISGLFCVWVCMFLVFSLTGIPICVELAARIQESAFLSVLYSYNPISYLLKSMSFPEF